MKSQEMNGIEIEKTDEGFEKRGLEAKT